MHIWNWRFSCSNKLFTKRSEKKKSVKRKLAESLLRLKYNAKFHLQLWAILSQLNEHDAAIEDAKRASEYWQESLKASNDLCLEIMKKKYSASKYDVVEHGNLGRKVSKSENRSNSFERSYDSRKSTMNELYKMKSSRINRHDRFVNKKGAKRNYNGHKNNSWIKQQRKELSHSRKSKSEKGRSRHSSISSSTSLVIRESIESDVLDQIHSFNLKRASINSQNESQTEFSSVNISNRRSSSTSSAQRAFYVSELVKVQDAELEKSIGVLDEVLDQIKEFN